MRLVPERYSSKDPAESKKKIETVCRRAVEQLRTLPGIESAATAAIVPMNDNVKFGGDVLVDGRAQAVRMLYTGNWIGPTYFKTMGIPLLSGRDFLPSDREEAPRVVILNQSMARRLFGEQNPVGHSLRFHGDPTAAIVGVVKKSRRTREIGVRVALGARPATVGYMVFRSSLLLVGAGLVAGGALSYFAQGPSPCSWFRN
jgi:ABC-type antimicrobial peptide transport system permease subunit